MVVNSAFPKELTHALAASSKIAVLTGAGMSAESGVPTFRDAQTGLWQRYRPEQLASPQAFRRDPELVWRWYAWRRELIAQAEPHAGHRALVELAARVPDLTLITQNVDGLHQRAGSTDVVCLHGDITADICAGCGRWLGPDERRPAATGALQACRYCGDLVRPGVVWFGERLPEPALEAALRAAAECDLWLSIGTSGTVEPAASLPFRALARDATVAEINATETPLSARAHHRIAGEAGRILPALMARAFG